MGVKTTKAGGGVTRGDQGVESSAYAVRRLLAHQQPRDDLYADHHSPP